MIRFVQIYHHVSFFSLYQIVLVPYLVSKRQLIGDSRELFAIAEDETYQELKLSHFIYEFLHMRHAPII